MIDNNLPLVSICIPTYNGAQFIEEALDSAMQQTYANLEIIVSDDASKDDTLAIVQSYKTKTLIPIYIHSHKPKGIGANWNHTVRRSNGVYIKFLFQDDVLLPHCVEDMMRLMVSNPKVGLVYSKRELIYESLTPKIEAFIAYYGDLHSYWDRIDVKPGVLAGSTYLKDRQLLNSPKNKIGEPTNVLLNRDCFKTIGYFNEELQQSLDSDYWYRVMTKYDIGFINENLSKFRLHDKQASNVNKKRDIPDKELIYRRYYNHLYTYLHPKNKLKLLKLYHPLFKTLLHLKRFFYAI